MNFTELGIQQPLVKALAEQGINEPTAIQQKAIPEILVGKDIIAKSKTGSGKTAAFGVPALQNITAHQGVQLLIIAPTRELVVQIAEELQKFSKYLGLGITPVYGGVSYAPQEEGMARSEIVVSTPGRLLDHLNQRSLSLDKLKCVVLDEADKMVEMGFIEDIEAIFSYLPAQRQILLFGATISDEIDQLKNKFMHDSVSVEAEMQVEQEFLQQYFYTLRPQEKFSLLVHLLKQEQIQQAIIFCSARSTVELVTRNLRMQGIKADMLHGKLSQTRRLQVIRHFHESGQGVLVASAVAARGLHIDGVSHVFNYDLSQDPQEYIHRVGRTARAGEKGKAITLLSERDFEVFRDILSRYRLPVEELPLGNFPRLPFDARQERPFQRFGSNRFEGPRASSFGNRSSSFGERRSGSYHRGEENYGRSGRTLPSAPGWRK